MYIFFCWNRIDHLASHSQHRQQLTPQFAPAILGPASITAPKSFTEAHRNLAQIKDKEIKYRNSIHRNINLGFLAFQTFSGTSSTY
jgi:hypothetical protein